MCVQKKCYKCYKCCALNWEAKIMLKPMISPAVPNALLLGIWVAEGRAAVTGSLRDARGETTPDVLTLAGEPWTALVQALEQAALMDVINVVILSNDAALVQSLSPPFAPPKPDHTERVWYSRTEWADVGVGGNAVHWRALQLLGGRWGGHFRAMVVEDLPKARELWEQQSKSDRQ